MSVAAVAPQVAYPRAVGMSVSALEELVAAFCDGTLPRGAWTHAAHLRVGAWHVHRHGAAEALELLRERIRRLNGRHGTVNSETGGYHETITAAYVKLIAAFLAAPSAEGELAARVEELVAGPLGDRSVLLRFWSREVLMAPAARRAWVAPDLAPLALPV
jgi:hypothetical protein